MNFIFFDEHFEKGVPWYASRFRRKEGVEVVGEKTPSYSYYPLVQERIYEVLPNVKLVWIFRDPVERAYSHYWHNVRKGRERLGFSEAIEAEGDRIKRNMFVGYTWRGMYVNQANYFRTYFDEENMLFLSFEDMKKSAFGAERSIRFRWGEEKRNSGNGTTAQLKNLKVAPLVTDFAIYCSLLFGEGRSLV